MLVTIASETPLKQVRAALQGMGLSTTVLRNPAGQGSLWVEHPSRSVSLEELRAVPGVADVATRESPHPRVDRQGAVVVVGDIHIGGIDGPVLMAGPCSVESEAQIHRAAQVVARAGARFLRGGAFKPRTSPYSFQGHGLSALRWMRAAAEAHQLKVVTEVMAPSQAETVAEWADLLQIGSRNMQNYDLLRAVGALGMPVLLKRSASATLEEWLLAAEHLLNAGGSGVIFCERGIRGFDRETRYVLDIAAVTLLRDVYNVPVIVDPSHATGRRDLIQRLSMASLVAGANGVLVESHPEPSQALSDGPQQLNDAEILALGASMGLRQSG
ncbi:MAG: 3-deoxy-7-phosphoheptulonate synthase [Myxococcota bacterium]